MSKNWVSDIAKMHKKFGVNDVVSTFDEEKLKAFLEFRLKFLKEELTEGIEAASKGDYEEVVDAMIDLCVVAIGTLDAFEVDSHEAWNRVHKANMRKKVGIKDSRPNPLGLPDLIKPKRWKSPTHEDNLGLFEKMVDKTPDT